MTVRCSVVGRMSGITHPKFSLRPASKGQTMWSETRTHHSKTRLTGFGGLEVACWPLVPKFAGSNPTETVPFFQGEKILSMPFFGGEVKPSVPCSTFAACKRSLNVTWKSGIFRQNSSAISRSCSSTFGC